MSVDAYAADLAAALAAVERGLILVVTGAGVSLASGIPTFRGSDPDAVWKRDVTELGTVDYFRRDPVGSWRWYLERFETVLAARPNPAHQALAALERWQLGRGGRFLLVTQNIDSLHEQAGSRELVKVHGSAARVRCSRDGCRYGSPAGSLPRPADAIAAFLAAPSAATLPRCPECGGWLRQHVLWFDEYYDGHQDYQWRRVMEATDRAHLVLFVGTSFSVGVTDLALRAAVLGGVPAFSIDPGRTMVAASGLEQFPARGEELLPAVCRQLGAELVAQPASDG
jgi:NAD-dependent deacetylase